MMKNDQYPSQSYHSSILGEGYKKISHPSGLDIYIFPKDMTAAYAIFGVRYGSINNTFKNRDGQTVTVPDGIAHFLEHKLFTAEDGSDAFERFSDFGADANAYTSFNRTAYLFSCTEHFEDSLGELLHFVTHPYFTDETVKKEVGIIAEEIKMYDDSPAERCYYGMLEGLYETHSVRRNICGSEDTIKKITPQLLYDCYHAFYTLPNMALVICGSVDEELVLRVADKHLPSTPVTADAAVAINENSCESAKAFKPCIKQKMQVAKPLFCLGFKDTDIPTDPAQRLRKDAVMSVLDEMIFARSGDLYASLFERELISPAFSYGYTITESFAYHSLSGEADDPELVTEEVLRYIEKLRVEGLRKEDLERTKRVLYAEIVKGYDSTEVIASNLFSFVCEDMDMLSHAEVLASVTLEDVEQALKHSFRRECATLSVIEPLKN